MINNEVHCPQLAKQNKKKISQVALSRSDFDYLKRNGERPDNIKLYRLYVHGQISAIDLLQVSI